MGASVTLVTPAVAVEPGQTISIDIRVRNTGTVVDEFVLDVLGDAAGWAVVSWIWVDLDSPEAVVRRIQRALGRGGRP